VGSMPTYHVSKGSEFKFLETELFGNSAFRETYDLALAALADPDSTETLIAAAKYRHQQNPDDVSKGDLKHFRKHWLSSWWSHLAVADTLRAGFIEAITHARAAGKPMEVVWVCAQDDAFHVYYTESPNQVTVLVFTPIPDTGHVTGKSRDREFEDEPLVEPEDIWVVKQEDEWDGAAYQALGGPDSVVSPSEQVATVTTEGAGIGAPIIKQRLYHT
jgi:hypothetical protein